jgi:DNA-directed RNA polymerase subunit H
MPQTFHILQPKHTLLKQDEIEKLLEKYNISLSQLPKIKINDAAIPEKANVGDVVKIERKEGGGKIAVYYRVVVL